MAPYLVKISAPGKLLAFGILLAAAVLAPGPAALAPAAAMTLAAAFLAPGGWRRAGRALAGSAFLILCAMGFAFASERLAGAAADAGGLGAAAALGMRLALLAVLAAAFAAATPASEAARALFAPFRRMPGCKSAAADAALITAFAMQFAGDVGKRSRSAREAARMRMGGGRLSPARLAATGLILRAAYRDALALAATTAQALYLRGIETPAAWLEIRFPRKPFGWAAVTAAAAAAAATAALTYLWPTGLSS